MPLGSFGPFLIFGQTPLGIIPVEQIQKVSKTRWIEHMIHLGTPVSEFVGQDLDEITITMGFFRGYTTDPAVAFAVIDLLKSLGSPQFLILGASMMGGLSKFVIQEVTQTIKTFDAYGGFIIATATLKLKQYGDGQPTNALLNAGIALGGAIL